MDDAEPMSSFLRRAANSFYVLTDINRVDKRLSAVRSSQTIGSRK
jgi:hypothetical protein